LKKILFYSAVAVVLGLSLTLVPLFTVAEIRFENRYLMSEFLSGGLEKLEGTYGLGAPRYSAVNLEIFAISFVVALVVYVLFKRKMPRWI